MRWSIDGEDAMADETGDGEGPVLTVIEGGGEPPKKSKRRSLTAKQEAFVKALTTGGPDGKGMTQTEAYKSAYDCENMSDKAIYTEGWKLCTHHPEVTRRILSQQAVMAKAALSSALTRRRWIIERLEAEAVDMETGSPASRVRSLELLGKTERLFADVVETIQSDESPDEVRRELEARLTALLADG
jgi:hypothetical protein